MRNILTFILFLFAATGLTAAERVAVTYYGHACFMVTTPSRIHVLIDPFASNMNYKFPGEQAEIVLISHEHADHNNFGSVAGFPIILHGLKLDGSDYEAIDFHMRELHVTSVPCFHDADRGSQRGRNTIFILDIDRFRLVHLGDLGGPLTAEQKALLKHINVLMVPVGGFFTIDAENAAGLIRDLAPDVIIPMHYQTAATQKLPIDPVDKFLALVSPVFRDAPNPLVLDIGKPVAKPGIYVLTPR